MAVHEVEKLSVQGAMKMEPGSRIGLTGEDTDFDQLSRLKAEALIPIQEDLAVWLNKILGNAVSRTTYFFITTTVDKLHTLMIQRLLVVFKNCGYSF